MISELSIPKAKTAHSSHHPLLWWARGVLGFVALNAFAGAAILIFLPAETDWLFFWLVNPPGV
jgi:hypothetical protein